MNGSWLNFEPVSIQTPKILRYQLNAILVLTSICEHKNLVFIQFIQFISLYFTLRTLGKTKIETWQRTSNISGRRYRFLHPCTSAELSASAIGKGPVNMAPASSANLAFESGKNNLKIMINCFLYSKGCWTLLKANRPIHFNFIWLKTVRNLENRFVQCWVDCGSCMFGAPPARTSNVTTHPLRNPCQGIQYISNNGLVLRKNVWSWKTLWSFTHVLFSTAPQIEYLAHGVMVSNYNQCLLLLVTVFKNRPAHHLLDW